MSSRSRFRARPRRWAALLVGAAMSCAQPGSESGEPNDPAPAPVGPPACRDAGADLLTAFPGVRCLWTVSEAGGTVSLTSLDHDAGAAASGAPPAICVQRRCRYDGHFTMIGPLVIVTVASPDSEMPGGAWLGFSSGAALGFVDLWEDGGDEVWSEGTPLGPSHTLSPVLCGESLGFAAVPRTNAGLHVDPPESLRAREGVYAIQQGTATRTGDLPGQCVPVKLPLP
jgi:hypothetical protein